MSQNWKEALISELHRLAIMTTLLIVTVGISYARVSLI